ncbi:quinone-dependent dihydroorotate dehydrogenase [Lipingzhangella sp. LS1_29]|uniref:Dihydroorotate dehydrogenase (quinone) n=1 Tax=Lipingzhangella rawalii TaxID=2055835 RepID=A0ABU2HB51_9ACTN|nr:quinone-dependent dihydroorotate dehydrogenase [Lipingzhangella rawalii]MDS1272518.1 quinone-dependent dihydroorotate dehydrogenase [Lipingzhangella rawalii]
MLYQLCFHAVLRHLDSERVHRASFAALRAMARIPGAATGARTVLAPVSPDLRVRALGREFPGPLGLAAGFDKNAEGITAMHALGFGFVEIGTVTGQPQPGNQRPRLFRLVRDRAIVNRMGFNNDGSADVAERLRRYRARVGNRGAVVGVNIGKTKAVPESEAIADYTTSARRLAGLADYLVVNVSSPNTPGLRNLQAVDQLRPLLRAVRGATAEAGHGALPLLVKIAPDLSNAEVDAVADLAVELGLDGIIATNTTVSRANLATDPQRVSAVGSGGLSGAPLRGRALEVLRRLRARAGDDVVLIAVGGIETPADAWARIRAGATLVQGYTGLIYAGPLWPYRLQRGLVRIARAQGWPSLAAARGTAPASSAS